MMKPEILLLLLITLLVPRAVADDLEARAHFSIPRTNVYVGETMPLTLTIRSNSAGIGSDIMLAGMPSPGAVSFGQFKEAGVERKKVDDETREKRKFTSTATFHQEGKVDLSPKLKLYLIQISRSSFGVARSRISKMVDVTPLELNVHPLPMQGRPEKYTGAIGDFSLDVQVAPTNFVPGDLIEITARIHGTGNLDRARIRILDSAPMFKVYDPRIINSVPGRERTLKQIVAPQNPDADTIPRISFSFFDPGIAEYRTLSAGPFALNYNPDMDAEEPEQVASGESEMELSRKEEKSNMPFILAVSAFWIAAVILAVGARLLLKPRWLWMGLILAVALLTFPVFKQRAERLLTLKKAEIAEATEARIYPANSAASVFKLRPGQRVTVIESHEAWVKIETTEKRGWIPASALSERENRLIEPSLQQ